MGEAWAKGRLKVRHEHFVSERVGDVLRSLRLPLEERAAGPLVVLSTLPGEAHGLGLQMAALVTAFAGAASSTSARRRRSPTWSRSRGTSAREPWR